MRSKLSIITRLPGDGCFGVVVVHVRSRPLSLLRLFICDRRPSSPLLRSQMCPSRRTRPIRSPLCFYCTFKSRVFDAASAYPEPVAYLRINPPREGKGPRSSGAGLRLRFRASRELRLSAADFAPYRRVRGSDTYLCLVKASGYETRVLDPRTSLVILGRIIHW